MAIALALSALATPLPAAAADKAGCADKPFRIAIDAGHTPTAFGATSARGGREYDFNIRFANELVAEANRRASIKAFLISPKQPKLTLRDRVRLANHSGADLFLSIHHDSAQTRLLERWVHKGRKLLKSDTISGFSMFVSRANPRFSRSLRYAKAAATAWHSGGHKPTLHHAEPIRGENRELLVRSLGIYEAPFAVIKRTTIPAVLIEVGVLINPREEAWLNQKKNRAALQSVLVAALDKEHCQHPAAKPSRSRD